MRLAARTERLEGSGSGAIQVLLESADVDLDSDGCVATIEPVPTVRPVEWRGERARRLALLAFDPVAGVFILGRIDAFAVHVHGYGGVGGPMEHEGVSLVHVQIGRAHV